METFQSPRVHVRGGHIGIWLHCKSGCHALARSHDHFPVTLIPHQCETKRTQTLNCSKINKTTGELEHPSTHTNSNKGRGYWFSPEWNMLQMRLLPSHNCAINSTTLCKIARFIWNGVLILKSTSLRGCVGTILFLLNHQDAVKRNYGSPNSHPR